MQFSMTLSGLAVLLVSTMLKGANVEVPQEDVLTFVLVAAQVVGALLVWWGRVRKGDITWYGARK